jgi:hypothetical protein
VVRRRAAVAKKSLDRRQLILSRRLEQAKTKSLRQRRHGAVEHRQRAAALDPRRTDGGFKSPPRLDKRTIGVAFRAFETL